MRGRRPHTDSRSEEIRGKLVVWKQTPEAARPSLRALARELGTSHQLLSYYLDQIDYKHRKADLEQLRVLAEAKNVTVTPALERRYLIWLRTIEEQQARDAARAAKWACKHTAVLDRIKHLLPESGSYFNR